MKIIQKVFLCFLVNGFSRASLANEKERLNVRLTQSSVPNTGRLEVQRVTNGSVLSRWGTVCDSTFGEKEAQVVCRQLGFRFGKSEKAVYRDHESLFVLADVTCLGNETELSQCNRSPWLRHHCVSFTDFYAGVCCSNVSSFGEQINGSFTSHCRKTWSESTATCLRAGGYVTDVSFQGTEFSESTYWSNQIYTPWIALIGCFRLPSALGISGRVLSYNSPGQCVQICNGEMDINFGLSGELCYCLNSSTLLRVEIKICSFKCRGNEDQSCGDSLDHVSIYTIVPEEKFKQQTEPSSEKQCALLLRTGRDGKKWLSSEDCGQNHSYVCEHCVSVTLHVFKVNRYTVRGSFLYEKTLIWEDFVHGVAGNIKQNIFADAKETDVNFIAPGGEKFDMNASKGECNNLSMSLSGSGAIYSDKIFLNSPSWIDVIRYRVPNIQENDTASRFEAQYCVATSIDSSSKQTTYTEDCQKRHLFKCQKDKEETQIQAINASSLNTTNLNSPSTSLTVTATVVLSSTARRPIAVESETVTVVIIGSSCLLVLAACLACTCLCWKRWRKLTFKQSAYSGSTVNSTASEILTTQSEKDVHEAYSNTYATVRESSDYSNLIYENRGDTEAGYIELQPCSEFEISNTPSQNNISVNNEYESSAAGECYGVGLNYIEPNDAIDVRKTKLREVKSSTSYTYPYDSICKTLPVERLRETQV